MPRVALKREQYMAKDLTSYIVGKMYGRFTQAEMGEELGISQQAFGMKLRKAQFSFVELVKIFSKLESTDEEIARLLKK